ncbi:MAG TPA: glycosyltransferase family 9 protein [Candidatus Paceibacterota bacterium]|nr:glycosyltransferase family 9 protein [Candidatus Paceibacterota bacterium]
MASELATFYDRTRGARKILVVDLGFLGDSVHLVPALWELRRHYPEAVLHTLSAPVGREVLALAPCVDAARAFPLPPNSPPWWRQWKLLVELRRERYDVALNFNGADRTIFLTALTGARWRLAHAGGRNHFWNRWLIAEWVPRRSKDLPVYEQKRQVLAAGGFELGPPRWNLQIPEPAARRFESLSGKRVVHFSLCASDPLREWPLQHWIELSRQLLEGFPDLRIVVSASGARREQERLRSFAEGVAHERVVALPPGLAIAELAAALSRCRLHVGPDSGVLHLAMALGTPTLALFRDHPEMGEWLPRGPSHRHLSSPCPCVGQAHPPCRAVGIPRCLQAIQPGAVARLAEAALVP